MTKLYHQQRKQKYKNLRSQTSNKSYICQSVSQAKPGQLMSDKVRPSALKKAQISVVSTSSKRSVYKKRNSCKSSPLSQKLNNVIGSPKKHPKPPPEEPATDGLPSTARMLLESAAPSRR